MDQSTARITVIGRPGCHLCDDVLAVIAVVAAETGDTWTELDVDSDPELRQRYGDMIPVTLVDGRQVDYWRLEPARLRRALARGRHEPPA